MGWEESERDSAEPQEEKKADLGVAVGVDAPGGPVATTLLFQCRGPGSIPGQGTRSRMLQLQVPNAATKTPHSQLNE